MHRTAPTPKIDPALLDLAHLKRQTAADLALQRELLGLFAAHAPKLVTQMRELTRQPSSAKLQLTLCDLAHQLRGSALAIGAFPFAAAVETSERTFAETADAEARDRDEALKSLMERLAMALAQTLASIDAHLATLDAPAAL